MRKLRVAEVERWAGSVGLLILVAWYFLLDVGAGSTCSEFPDCFSHECFSAQSPFWIMNK